MLNLPNLFWFQLPFWFWEFIFGPYVYVHGLLIVLCLMSFSTLFEQPVYLSKLSWGSFTSTPHSILSKPLAASQHRQNNGQWWERQEWILSQRLSSILRKNIGQARDWTRLVWSFQFSRPMVSELEYGNELPGQTDGQIVGWIDRQKWWNQYKPLLLCRCGGGEYNKIDFLGKKKDSNTVMSRLPFITLSLWSRLCISRWEWVSICIGCKPNSWSGL